MAQTFPISHGAAEYPARCSLGDLANIEAACGAYGADGVRKPKAAALILSDLAELRFSRLDAQEPFRVAIIAGGAPAGEAARIVETIYEAEGLNALAGLSLAIMQIALMGVPRETTPEVKKKPRRNRSPSAPSG